MASKSMLASLLQKQLTYTPVPQSFHAFLNGRWYQSQPSPSPSQLRPSSSSVLTSLHLITWNIDFMASYPRARMSAALSHLKTLVTSIPATSAAVIFLQEMQELEYGMTNSEQQANDLTQLKNADWVRERFHMTDVDGSGWDGSNYGTVTLVDRRLSIAKAARLPFVSEFQRDALFVDVRLSCGEEGGIERVLRLCNVHLDSMSGSMRPIQWKALEKLRQPQRDEAWIAASIVAGDCNANQPRDWTEPRDNGFLDAYLELGGEESDEEGATWGFQSKNWQRWGRKRFDKVVFWGDVQASRLERVGIDVRVEEETIVQKLEELEELPFATDHYGLMGVFAVDGGLQTEVNPDSVS